MLSLLAEIVDQTGPPQAEALFAAMMGVWQPMLASRSTTELGDGAAGGSFIYQTVPRVSKGSLVPSHSRADTFPLFSHGAAVTMFAQWTESVG